MKRVRARYKTVIITCKTVRTTRKTVRTTYKTVTWVVPVVAPHAVFVQSAAVPGDEALDEKEERSPSTEHRKNASPAGRCGRLRAKTPSKTTGYEPGSRLPSTGGTPLLLLGLFGVDE